MSASLTSLAPSGGCAAKYPAARLEELLRGFLPAEAENLLVGLAPSDDAAVYKLDDERALVFTLDFFPPLVDDPALYGRIAATNALNDVFAMGGSPLLALSIAAFPESLPNETLAAIFGAADEQVRAAGAILAGGHTLRDEEPKYGLAVVGTVHPDGFWAKSGARAGDAVFLTKPLGTGMLLHAARQGRRHEEGLEAATEAMTALNRDAADALRPFEPNAVTDVTGFGLLGHAHEMAERSGVRIEPKLPRSRSSPARRSRPRRGSGRAAIGATGISPARTWTRTGCPRHRSRSRTTRRPRRPPRLAAGRQGCGVAGGVRVAEALRVPGRKRRRGIRGFAALIAAAALAGCGGDEQADLLVTAPRLFDGHALIRDGAVAIKGDEIAAVGRRVDVDVDAARTIRLPNATLLPGLIDLHTHGLGYGQAGSVVTTVRDLGTDDRNLPLDGPSPGPRVLAAGPLITAPGGYPIPIHGRQVAHVVRDPDERGPTSGRWQIVAPP